MDHLFVGQIVHSKSLSDLEIFTHGFLAVQDGEVIKDDAVVRMRCTLFTLFSSADYRHRRCQPPGRLAGATSRLRCGAARSADRHAVPDARPRRLSHSCAANAQHRTRPRHGAAGVAGNVHVSHGGAIHGRRVRGSSVRESRRKWCSAGQTHLYGFLCDGTLQFYNPHPCIIAEADAEPRHHAGRILCDQRQEQLGAAGARGDTPRPAGVRRQSLVGLLQSRLLCVSRRGGGVGHSLDICKLI